MKVQRIVWYVLILGTLAVFVLAMVPEEAWAPPFTLGESSKPGAQSPASQPTTSLPISKSPAVQPPAGHTGPRLPAPPGPAPGAVLPHFKPGGGATGQLPPPGQAKGFDVFTPSESGKMLPGAPRGMDPGDDMPAPEGPVSWDPGEKPGPGNAEGIIVQTPGEAKGIIIEDKPAPGKTKGIIIQDIPAPEAAQAAK